MIEKKTLKLKEIFSHIEVKDFIFSISEKFNLNLRLEKDKSSYFLEAIITEEKLLRYFMGLIISSKKMEPTYTINEKKQEIESYISSIGNEYFKMIDKDNLEKIKKMIALNAYIAYHAQENFKTREQNLEIIKELYGKYKEKIYKITKLKLEDFLEIEKFFYKEELQKKNELYKLFKLELNNVRNEKIKKFMSEEIKKLEKEIKKLYITTYKELEETFGREKIDKFLNIFSMERQEIEFYYLTGENPYLEKPILKINENEYITFVKEQLLDSISKYLDKILMQCGYKNDKGEIIEDYVIKILKDFFGDTAKIYSKVCEEPKTKEHDFLIEIDNVIIIGEVKSGKIKIGNRNLDVEKTFMKIKDHFNSSSGIGHAYIQTEKLKKFLINNEKVILYPANQKKIEIENAKNKKIISVIITLEEYGAFAVNIDGLLDKEKEAQYPWICSVFKLKDILKKLKTYESDEVKTFIDYLEFRIKEHENILAIDELDIVDAKAIEIIGYCKIEKYYWFHKDNSEEECKRIEEELNQH